jgi:NTE family protein
MTRDEGGIAGDVVASKERAGIAKHLQECELLQLDAEAALKMAGEVQRVVLKRGELLFRRGDESDSAYLLATGRMNAIVEHPGGVEEVVGIIRRGESIGEMGLLSGQPRSLSIRAHRESTLLRLSREVIESLPQASLIRFFQLVTQRSQSTINRLFSRHHEPELIAIVPWTAGLDVRGFVASLAQQWPAMEQCREVDYRDPGLESGVPAKAPGGSKITVFVRVDWEDKAAAVMACENADRVLCVVDRARANAIDPTSLELLGPGSGTNSRKDLVVLHPGEIDGVQAFLDSNDFDRYFNVRNLEVTDLQRAARILAGRSIGVTLSGGGIRGWAHVGALKALTEWGGTIDAVGGTSAGACLAGLWSITNETKVFMDLFRHLVRSVGNPLALPNLTFPIVSLLNGRRGTRALREIFGDRRIENLPINYYSVSCNFGQGKEALHRSGELWKWVRASSAVPGLLPPLVEDGQVYLDGGVVNNLPVNHMRDFLGPGGEIVAIDISDAGGERKDYYCPHEIGWLDSLLLRRRARRQGKAVPHLSETFIQSLLMGSQSRLVEYSKLADVVVRPELKNCGMLSTDQKDQLLHAGYEAAMKALQQHRWRNCGEG